MQEEMLQELEAMMCGFWLTDWANFCSFFYHRIPQLNWIGFYITDGTKLRLGPFQGKPACLEIAFERGVCGAAFSTEKSLMVNDVHEFPGHISCDPDSQSELVIPFYVHGELMGVLDIDSPVLDRFSDEDLELFENALKLLPNEATTLQAIRNAMSI